MNRLLNDPRLIQRVDDEELYNTQSTQHPYIEIATLISQQYQYNPILELIANLLNRLGRQ